MPVSQSEPELNQYRRPHGQKQLATSILTGQSVCFFFFLHLLWFYSCLPSFPPLPPLLLLSLAQSLSDCSRGPSNAFSFNPPRVLTVHHLKAPLRLRTIYPCGGRCYWEELVQGRQVSGWNCKTDDGRPRRTGLTYRLMVITWLALCRGEASWHSEIGL